MKLKVNKNEIYTLEIVGMSHEGMGIGKIDGYAVFIEGAIVGEEVEIKIVKANKNFAYGKLLKIIKPSPSRINPMCLVSKRCGGCHLQHMAYEKQLEFKTQKVKDAIERIGKIKDVIIHDTLGMTQPLRYRNKIQYPVGEKEGRVIVGFYASRSHEIIESSECIIQDDKSEQIAKFIRDFINMHKLSVYNEVEHKGLIRHIVTRIGFKTGEVMLIIVTNGKHLPKKDVLIKEVTSKFPDIKSIIQNINTEKTNVVLGEKCITLYGSDSITDYIGELKFKISPLSFYQVNSVQTEVLYNKVLEYAELVGNETVFDAYCGIGTISLFLSKKAKKVYGIEIVPQAIHDARENAEINGISNVEFIEGEAEVIIPKLYNEGIKADLIVVDPPRKGCDKKLLDTIIKMNPEKMVYVSCDVSTLARDLNYLQEGGYKVLEIQPVDMFPYTHHIESVVLLKRKHSP